MISEKKYFLLLLSLLLAAFFLYRDVNSPYLRSINADGKGYYAYLPALFLYQDPSFDFIHDAEKNYYPEDGSHFKDFLNEQPNGTKVNKTFPGLSILYAPFFFLGCLFAFVFGYPVDGYSMPFQLMIGLSHIVYLLLGFRFLWGLLKNMNISEIKIAALLSLLLFGTNLWYYVIYDHTVSHVFSFFLASVLLWAGERWVSERKHLGLIFVLTALIVIIRPTNAIMFLCLLYFPFVSRSNLRNILPQLKELLGVWKSMIISIVILIIPPLMWKWQTGNWIVYSYKDEGFDFLHPHWIEFMFSPEKGWIFWSPVMLFLLFIGIFYSFKRKGWLGIIYLLPLVLITYVLSSWWCWTFGAGMGQRVMIEYYPYILVPVALFLNEMSRRWVFPVLFVFIPLNLFQAYQVVKSVHVGGQTTWDSYKSNFFRLKPAHQKVMVPENWKLIKTESIDRSEGLNESHPYSASVETKVDVKSTGVKILIEVKAISSIRESRIVISDLEGEFYKALFLKEIISSDTEKFEFLIDDVPQDVKELKVYVWNGDTKEQLELNSIRMLTYQINE